MTLTEKVNQDRLTYALHNALVHQATRITILRLRICKREIFPPQQYKYTTFDELLLFVDRKKEGLNYV